MAESIGVEGRGSFYEGSGRSATCCRTTSCRSSRCWRWSRRPIPTRRSCRTRRPRCWRRWSRSTRLHGARPVHRLPRGARRRSALQGRDVRRRPPADRLVALGRRAVVRAGRQGAGRTPSPRPWSSCASRRSCCSTRPAARRRAQPGPLPARQERRRDVRPPGEDARSAPRQPGGRHQRRLRGRARRAPRGLRAAAQRRHRRLAPALRPRGRRRADVARRAAGARRARRDPPVLPRTWGPSEADRVLCGDRWFEPPEAASCRLSRLSVRQSLAAAADGRTRGGRSSVVARAGVRLEPGLGEQAKPDVAAEQPSRCVSCDGRTEPSASRSRNAYSVAPRCRRDRGPRSTPGTGRPARRRRPARRGRCRVEALAVSSGTKTAMPPGRQCTKAVCMAARRSASVIM